MFILEHYREILALHGFDASRIDCCNSLFMEYTIIALVVVSEFRMVQLA